MPLEDGGDRAARGEPGPAPQLRVVRGEAASRPRRFRALDFDGQTYDVILDGSDSSEEAIRLPEEGGSGEIRLVPRKPLPLIHPSPRGLAGA